MGSGSSNLSKLLKTNKMVEAVGVELSRVLTACNFRSPDIPLKSGQN